MVGGSRLRMVANLINQAFQMCVFVVKSCRKIMQLSSKISQIAKYAIDPTLSVSDTS